MIINLKKIDLKILSVQKMIDLGNTIGKLAYPQMVIALNGDLGAGKTTLTKGIGQALGVSNTINSPTFTIMKVYSCHHQNIKNLYHLDVYRTQGSKSDFDLEEYFYLDGLTVIEWADIIDDLLPYDVIRIDIMIIDENTRQVIIQSYHQNFMNKLIHQLKEGKKDA